MVFHRKEIHGLFSHFLSMDPVSETLLCVEKTTLFSCLSHKKSQGNNITSSGQWKVDGSDTFYF